MTTAEAADSLTDDQRELRERARRFVEDVLMPLCDTVCDMHSGGSSLHYVPSTVIPRWSETDRLKRSIELIRAFGSPAAYVLEPVFEHRIGLRLLRISRVTEINPPEKPAPESISHSKPAAAH